MNLSPNTSGLRPRKKGDPSLNPNGRHRKEAKAAAEVLFGKARAEELCGKTMRSVIDGWECLVLFSSTAELRQLIEWPDCPSYPYGLAKAVIAEAESGVCRTLLRLAERQFGRVKEDKKRRQTLKKAVNVTAIKNDITVVLQADNRYSDSLLYEIEALATSLCTMRRAQEELKGLPLLIEEVTTQGSLMRVNPLIKVQQAAAADVERHCKALGLTADDMVTADESNELADLTRRLLEIKEDGTA